MVVSLPAGCSKSLQHREPLADSLQHRLFAFGPPGVGKALLTRALPSLLPATMAQYPLRAPHFSIGLAALIGEPSVPGELTLAHNGVLFLEGIEAFDPSLLVSLRQAIEIHVGL